MQESLSQANVDRVTPIGHGGVRPYPSSSYPLVHVSDQIPSLLLTMFQFLWRPYPFSSYPL